jgi:hypothetical protein
MLFLGLLEQKGIHHGADEKKDEAVGSSDKVTDEPAEKKSLKEKIKEKLHRH